MHKIFELKEMGLEEVQSIATELKIKNVKKKDKEKLIYEILDEEAVQANGAIKLSATAKEVAEGMVQLNRLRIQAHDLDEKINRLVGLHGIVAQQKRQALGVVLVNAFRRLLVLFEIHPAQPPAGGKKNRDRNQIPEFEFHLLL